MTFIKYTDDIELLSFIVLCLLLGFMLFVPIIFTILSWFSILILFPIFMLLILPSIIDFIISCIKGEL